MTAASRTVGSITKRRFVNPESSISEVIVDPPPPTPRDTAGHADGGRCARWIRQSVDLVFVPCRSDDSRPALGRTAYDPFVRPMCPVLAIDTRGHVQDVDRVPDRRVDRWYQVVDVELVAVLPGFVQAVIEVVLGLRKRSFDDPCDVPPVCSLGGFLGRRIVRTAVDEFTDLTGEALGWTADRVGDGHAQTVASWPGLDVDFEMRVRSPYLGVSERFQRRRAAAVLPGERQFPIKTGDPSGSGISTYSRYDASVNASSAVTGTESL